MQANENITNEKNTGNAIDCCDCIYTCSIMSKSCIGSLACTRYSHTRIIKL